jgi:hypothetical protein
MIDDPSSLASRYLDGDVTVDERARVEGDPGLLAEVSQLRVIRALLAERDEPVISVRERHLATALDAWDRLPDAERTGALRDATPDGVDGAAAAGLASMSAPARSRTGARRRFQSTTWLGAAAAGLVIVLAGGLILRPGSSNDDTASSATADTQALSAAGAESSASADDALRVESDLEEASADAAAPSAEAPTELGSDVDTDLAEESPPPDDGALEVLTSPDDLAVFASNAFDAPSSAELPEGVTVVTDAPVATERGAPTGSGDDGEATDELRLCLGADRVVGLASYDGQTVVVAIDDGNSLALAYLAANCTEVARASLR